MNQSLAIAYGIAKNNRRKISAASVEGDQSESKAVGSVHRADKIAAEIRAKKLALGGLSTDREEPAASDLFESIDADDSEPVSEPELDPAAQRKDRIKRIMMG